MNGNRGRSNLLFILPPGADDLRRTLLDAPGFNGFLYGRDAYAPTQIDYVVGFRAPPGLLKNFPELKAVFSLGAGIDGFLRDPEFPRQVPLVRFVDETLQREMAQYVTMHVLMIHRQQRALDAAQKKSLWLQRPAIRSACDLRIGIMGMGAIGATTAERLATFGFQLFGYSRSPKSVARVKCFAGAAELPLFLGRCHILVCMLPLTAQTENILDAELFAQLPKGAWLINVGRGGHLREEDLLSALESGQLAGAVLDVFQNEPLPPHSPFWTHPKVRVTPHIAGLTDAKNAAEFVLDCLRRAETGEPLRNLVNVARGY